MADGTLISPSGDVIADEDIGPGLYKLPVSKLRTGPHGVDGDDVVAESNDLPVHDTIGRRLLEDIFDRLEDVSLNLRALAEQVGTGEVITAQRSSVATTRTVSASTTAVTIAVVNRSREGLSIYVDDGSTATLYLGFGQADAPAVSTTRYVARVKPGAYYELPFGYLGRVDGIWDGAAGTALVTEFV